MKLPSFQFYPGDWRKDPGVQSLSFEDRGIWFEMLCLMHESDNRGMLTLNGKPMPEESLARLLGLDKQNLGTTLTTLLSHGVCSRCEQTGAIICRRMVRDEETRKIRQKCGKLGGNPLLLNHDLKQNSTTKVKQIPTPSSSSSSSSSSSEEDAYKEEHHRKRPSSWPTIESALFHGDKVGCPKEQVEQFWHHFESTGWTDKNGNPIHNWQSKLVTWKIQAQEKQATQPKTGGGSAATRISLEKEYERLKADLDELKNELQYKEYRTQERLDRRAKTEARIAEIKKLI